MGELKLGKRVLKTPAVCGAIQGSDVDEMKSAISSAVKQGVDLVELRIDSLRDTKGWTGLLGNGPVAIVTNRARREGGAFDGTEEKRVRVLLEAIAAGAQCVDLEFSMMARLRNRVVKEAKKRRVTVLMSHHDFSATPSVETLIGIAKRMAKAGAGIVKIITTANNTVDSLRVLDFLIDVQNEISVPVIAFAMGEPGKMSRIASLLLGSPLTYASVGKPTAPGQLSVAETKKLLRKLMAKGR